jgi:hypothetical protein
MAVGIICRKILFNPASVSSVVVHDPLPAGFSINNHGILAGYVESIEGESETHTISLTVTDINGDSSDVELRIVITNVDLTKIPTNANEVIPYELNVGCAAFCGGNYQCSFRTCPTFVACYCSGKGICSCAQ